VFRWDDNKGYIQTTAAEASKKYPCGCAIKSHEFYCGLCGQWAELTRAGKNVAHFKHGNNSEDCEEKLTASLSSRLLTNPLGLSLPLRLDLKPRFCLSIGLLPLTASELEQAALDKHSVTITGDHGKTLARFPIDQERFEPERSTYLSVGSEPQGKYCLAYPGDTVQNRLLRWPKVVDGIQATGTFFSDYGPYGKRLPKMARVTINQDYYLLKKWCLPECNEVIIEKIQVLPDNWSVYRVRATQLTKDTAQFFLKFGTFLGEKVAHLIELWPPARRTPHFIWHRSVGRVWFSHSDGQIEIYPHNWRPTANPFSVPGRNEQVVFLSLYDNHTDVLRYKFVRRITEPTVKREASPIFHVTSEDGNMFEGGASETLPTKGKLKIASAVDGIIKVLIDGFCYDKIPVIGGKPPIAINVSFGQQIELYQGLDLVYSVAFQRLRPKQSDQNDDLLFQMLKKSSGAIRYAPHSLGVLVDRLYDKPKCRAWLLSCIRRGVISAEAVTILCNSGEGR
jgi:hypothetical protein